MREIGQRAAVGILKTIVKQVQKLNGYLYNIGASTSGGDVSKVGTPAATQIGVWTGDGTIENDPNLIWTGTDLSLDGGTKNVNADELGLLEGVTALGDVSKVGTPVDDQIGVWTGDGTIEGTNNFRFASNNLYLGVEDFSQALLRIYGDAGNDGGQILLYNGATGDTNDDYYTTSADTGIFKISGDLTGTFLTYTSATEILDLPKTNQMSAYGGGTITGTPAYTLNVDASGNIIETALPENPLTFSNGLTRTVDAVALGDAAFTSDILLKSVNRSKFTLISEDATGNLYAETESSTTTRPNSYISCGDYTAAGTQAIVDVTSNTNSTSIVMLQAWDDVNQISLSLNTSTGAIVGDGIFNKGLVYAADYTANFTDRSLVDKGYVDAGDAHNHAMMYDEDNTDAYVINAQTDFHSYHTNGMASANLAGFTFDAGGAGVSFPIASIADGVATGVDIEVTTTGSNLLAVGDIVSHTNLTSAVYTGIFVVKAIISATQYEVEAVYTATDTGTMNQAATLEATIAGTLEMSYGASATSATLNEVFDWQLMKNASHVVGSKSRRKFSGVGDYGDFGKTALVDVIAGDKISFAFRNNDSAGDTTIRNFTLVITEL